MTTHRYLVLIPSRGASVSYPEEITVGDIRVSMRQLPELMADAHLFAGAAFCHIAWPPNSAVDDRVRAYLQSRVRPPHPSGCSACPDLDLRFWAHAVEGEPGQNEISTSQVPRTIADTGGLRTDAILDQYFARRPLARQAHAYDQQYHQQTELLRRLLAGADSAMELEHIPRDVRDRVFHRILYGSLDEKAALERVVNLEAQQQRLRQAPLHFVASPEMLLAAELLADARRRNTETATGGKP
ncbi:hypothetical protein KCMC57_64570 (plasmid) [Kitasatospora sp. CMC57]|uniref:Uncharacterized protein n=1 Tax=Kitasatospora sp. CMC57 TaxID=3231513 RepID=A0AB33K3D1_9ACTN